MYTEKDFIECLLFVNRKAFLEELIHRFPKKFKGFKVTYTTDRTYELINKQGDYEDLNDILDYELDLSLNEIGQDYFLQYSLGSFFDENDAAEIIANGIEFNLISE